MDFQVALSSLGISIVLQGLPVGFKDGIICTRTLGRVMHIFLKGFCFSVSPNGLEEMNWKGEKPESRFLLFEKIILKFIVLCFFTMHFFSEINEHFYFVSQINWLKYLFPVG